MESAIKADRDVVDYVKSAVRDLRGKSKNSMSNHRYAMLKRTTVAFDLKKCCLNIALFKREFAPCFFFIALFCLFLVDG